MKTIGNILWLLLVGWHTAIGWLVLGVLLCLPIITIPFAVQCFKFAGFTLWPFGRVAVRDPGVRAGSLVGNILWFIPGLLLALGYAIGGLLLFVTIIGIPFGIQAFKFVGLAIAAIRSDHRLQARRRPPTRMTAWKAGQVPGGRAPSCAARQD